MAHGFVRPRWLKGGGSHIALMLALTAFPGTCRCPPDARPVARPVGASAPSASMMSAAAHDNASALRVCADPNNRPFSNRKGEGFENQIASLLAVDLHEPLRYVWWAQRRGFVRNTLVAHACDVVIGIAEHDPLVVTTPSYYRSTYVFVYQTDRHYHLRSLDDPRLHHLRIGVHVISADYNALPPSTALTRRGIINNVVGYSIYGNYAQPNPPARLVDAVAKGDVDVAIIWGPFAGYFAPHEPVPLTVVPVAPRMAMPGMPFDFGIAMGVRHGDTVFAATLERFLATHADSVRLFSGPTAFRSSTRTASRSRPIARPRSPPRRQARRVARRDGRGDAIEDADDGRRYARRARTSARMSRRA